MIFFSPVDCIYEWKTWGLPRSGGGLRYRILTPPPQWYQVGHEPQNFSPRWFDRFIFFPFYFKKKKSKLNTDVNLHHCFFLGAGGHQQVGGGWTLYSTLHLSLANLKPDCWISQKWSINRMHRTYTYKEATGIRSKNGSKELVPLRFILFPWIAPSVIKDSRRKRWE